jgi:hypothetical protein
VDLVGRGSPGIPGSPDISGVTSRLQLGVWVLIFSRSLGGSQSVAYQPAVPVSAAQTYAQGYAQASPPHPYPNGFPQASPLIYAQGYAQAPPPQPYPNAFPQASQPTYAYGYAQAPQSQNYTYAPADQEQQMAQLANTFRRQINISAPQQTGLSTSGSGTNLALVCLCAYVLRP